MITCFFFSFSALRVIHSFVSFSSFLIFSHWNFVSPVEHFRRRPLLSLSICFVKLPFLARMMAKSLFELLILLLYQPLIVSFPTFPRFYSLSPHASCFCVYSTVAVQAFFSRFLTCQGRGLLLRRLTSRWNLRRG